MQNAAVGMTVPKAKGGLITELFGQLVSGKFWKELIVFTLKTAVRVAGEMMIVAGGHALVEMGRRFGKGNDADVASIKERFQTAAAPVAPPAPVAAAFSRGFNPGSEYGRPAYTPPAQDNGGWPGLANFGR